MTREQVIMEVVWGDLCASNLTEEELEDLVWRVNEIVTDRLLEQALAEGKTVFSGRDQGLLN